MANGNLAAKRAAAAKREKERQAKIAQRKSQAGKAGYDKYGAKTVSQKRKEKLKSESDARAKKRLKEKAAHEKGIKERAKTKAQVEKIKKNISGKSTVDQTELRAKRRAETDKGSSQRLSNIKNKAKGGKGLQLKKYDKFGKKDLKTPDLVTKGRIGKLDAQIKKQKEEKPAAKAKKELKPKNKFEQRLKKRQERKAGKTDKVARLKDKAESAKRFGADKKADRLARRALRKKERKEGTRKSAVGTALSKVGRGAFGALAALGGSDAAIRKAGTEGAFFKKAAHVKSKKSSPVDKKVKKPTKMQKAAKAHFSKLAKTKMDTKIKKPKKTKY